MTTKELKQYIRNGKYAWPGGYPVYFETSGGETLSFETVKGNLKRVLYAIKYLGGYNGWHVKYHRINWQDSTLRCDHSGELIECAYGED